MSGGTKHATPDYWSFVVFGDLQRMMDDYRTSADNGYTQLEAAVDWIFAHKQSERIGFVMAVGDLIQTGVTLPPDGTEVSECDNETPPSYTATAETCYALAADETSCKAEPGCYWYSGLDGDGPTCASCIMVERAETEWTGFDALWARFEPGGDTTEGLPALLVRGNHDNVGTEHATNANREPLGWNDRYDDGYWSGLVNTYSDRFYQYLSGYSDSTTGDNHAWFVEIGGRRVLVVTISCCTATGVPTASENWALGVMAAFPNVPAIVLTHHAESVETDIVDVADSEAPNLFAYFGGHDGHRVKSIEAVGLKEILRSETDWTTASGTPSNDYDASRTVQNDYMTLVRIWLNSGEIEVVDFSANGNSANITSTNRIEKQDFSIDPL